MARAAKSNALAVASAVVATVREDLETLKRDVQDDLREADRHAALAVVYAARAGGRFLAMKEIVESTRGYGSWALWIAGNVQLSARSVQFYMQLARSYPELANPNANIAEVLEASPPARELAGMSLRRAMLKMAEPKDKATKKPETPKEPEPSDPAPIVEAWIRKQVPLASQQDQDAIATAYLAVRKEWPPSAELLELCCEMWAMGQRSAKAGREAVQKIGRTGRPRPGARP